MWASLPRPLEYKAIDSIEVATSAAEVLQAAEASLQDVTHGQTFPELQGPGRGGHRTEMRQLAQRLDDLRNSLIDAMNDCHSCARRAIEASDATCTLIDKSWADLCAQEEEARKRGEGFDGFIAEYKSASSAKQAAKVTHTAAGKSAIPAGDYFDPVFTALLDLETGQSTKRFSFGIDPTPTIPQGTQVRRIMQNQMHAMVDTVMAAAWSCLSTCWNCKHWLAKDMWWCCSWADNTNSIPSPGAAMPLRLIGSEITAVNANSSSTNFNAAQHRQMCVSTFNTFYEAATALAKATERLLRCDIAGQRSDGGSGAVVVLAPELTGSAEPSALKKAVNQLSKLRKGLSLLDMERSRK
eukprot:g778.t1